MCKDFYLMFVQSILARIIATLSSIESIYPETNERRKTKRKRDKEGDFSRHLHLICVRIHRVGPFSARWVRQIEAQWLIKRLRVKLICSFARQQYCDTMIHLFPEQLLLFVRLSLPAPNARRESSGAWWYALILTKRNAALRETVFSIWNIPIQLPVTFA